MKKTLDIDQWTRKDHFHFFRKFEEPFFGVTITIDCTEAYAAARSAGVSFFVYYLHKTLSAVNETESFRYRISGDSVDIFDRIDASPTLGREDGTFAFSFFEYNPDLTVFAKIAAAEIERVKKTPGLFTREFPDNIIHFSALPWIDFTSMSHARSFSIEDSCPKISFGKMSVSDERRRTIPVSIHVHHGLMDGSHVGQFIDRLQELMNGN